MDKIDNILSNIHELVKLLETQAGIESIFVAVDIEEVQNVTTIASSAGDSFLVKEQHVILEFLEHLNKLSTPKSDVENLDSRYPCDEEYETMDQEEAGLEGPSEYTDPSVGTSPQKTDEAMAQEELFEEPREHEVLSHMSSPKILDESLVVEEVLEEELPDDPSEEVPSCISSPQKVEEMVAQEGRCLDNACATQSIESFSLKTDKTTAMESSASSNRSPQNVLDVVRNNTTKTLPMAPEDFSEVGNACSKVVSPKPFNHPNKPVEGGFVPQEEVVIIDDDDDAQSSSIKSSHHEKQLIINAPSDLANPAVWIDTQENDSMTPSNDLSIQPAEETVLSENFPIQNETVLHENDSMKPSKDLSIQPAAETVLSENFPIQNETVLHDIHVETGPVPENAESVVIKKEMMVHGKMVAFGMLHYKCKSCGELFKEISHFEEHWESRHQSNLNQHGHTQFVEKNQLVSSNLLTSSAHFLTKEFPVSIPASEKESLKPIQVLSIPPVKVPNQSERVLQDIRTKMTMLPENAESVVVNKNIMVQGKMIRFGVVHYRCKSCRELFADVANFEEHWKNQHSCKEFVKKNNLVSNNLLTSLAPFLNKEIPVLIPAGVKEFSKPSKELSILPVKDYVQKENFPSQNETKLHDIHTKAGPLLENAENVVIKKEKMVQGKMVAVGLVHFKCKSCGELFKTVPNFENHWKSQHQSDTDQQHLHTKFVEKNKLVSSNLLTSLAPSLTKEIPVSIPDFETSFSETAPRYKCGICATLFTDFKLFGLHLENHHQIAQTSITTEGKCTADAGVLLYQCSSCEEVCTDYENFQKHLESHISATSSQQDNSDLKIEIDDENQAGPRNNERLVGNSKKRRALETMTPEKRFRCDACEQLFVELHDVQVHILDHMKGPLLKKRHLQ